MVRNASISLLSGSDGTWEDAAMRRQQLIVGFLALLVALTGFNYNAAARQLHRERLSIEEIMEWNIPTTTSETEYIQIDPYHVRFFTTSGNWDDFFTVPVGVGASYHGPTGGEGFDRDHFDGQPRTVNSGAVSFYGATYKEATFFIAPTIAEAQKFCKVGRRTTCDGDYTYLSLRQLGSGYCPHCQGTRPEFVKFVSADCTATVKVANGYRMFAHKKDGSHGRYSTATKVCVAYFWKTTHDQRDLFT